MCTVYCHGASNHHCYSFKATFNISLKGLQWYMESISQYFFFNIFRKRLSIDGCLEHRWLAQDVKYMRAKRLSTDKHKRFLARRKWQVRRNHIELARSLNCCVHLYHISLGLVDMSSVSLVYTSMYMYSTLDSIDIHVVNCKIGYRIIII